MEFRRRLTTIIGINLGVILILGVILFFTASDITKRTATVAKLRGELNLRTQTIESLAALRRDSGQAKNYLPELENIFPSRDQLVNLSRDLNIIANQNKISLGSSLGAEERQTGSKLSKINAVITGQGGFDNIINLLKGIKSSRYFIKINSLDLVRQQKDDFKISLNGQVLSF